MKKALTISLYIISILVYAVLFIYTSKIYAVNESFASYEKNTDCYEIAEMLDDFCEELNLNASVVKQNREDFVEIANVYPGEERKIRHFIKEKNLDEDCVRFYIIEVDLGPSRFDINKDEIINICDCAKYISILLKGYDKYMHDDYDYNDDGKKDILDVKFLLNKILNDKFPPMYT